jgi:phage-related protein
MRFLKLVLKELDDLDKKHPTVKASILDVAAAFERGEHRPKQYQLVRAPVAELKLKLHESQFRLLIARVDDGGHLALRAFRKTTRTTPDREIQLAQDRLKRWREQQGQP